MTAPVLVMPPGAPREDWLEGRRSGIGGSDIAAILGVNPYRTALHVYLDKLGELDDSGDSGAAYWGRVLEAPVAEHWARVHGKHLAQVGMWSHADRPWQLVTVDRLVYPQPVSGQGAHAFAPPPEAIYEGKTASLWKAGEWGDGEFVPDSYQAQCQWAMAVWGLPRVHIACLIGGQRFVEATIDRDQELIDDLLTVGAEFWDRIVRRIPPSLEGAPAGPALDLLRKLHGTGNGEVVDIGEHGLDLLAEYQRAKADEKAARERAKAAHAAIWELLGDAAEGQVDGEVVVRLANEPRAGHAVKPSNPRVLRPKKKAIGAALAARAARAAETSEGAA